MIDRLLHPKRHNQTLPTAAEPLLNSDFRSLSAAERASLGADVKRCTRLQTALYNADDLTGLLGLERAVSGCKAGDKLPSVKHLAKQAWHDNKPTIAFLLVEMRRRSAGAYMQAFPQARDRWFHLVDEGYISPSQFMARFTPTATEIDTWLDHKALPMSACVQLLAGQPELLQAIAPRHPVKVDVLCQRGPVHMRAAMARTLLEKNFSLGAEVLDAMPRLRDHASDLFARGAISFSTYAASVPRPTVEEGNFLLQSGRITAWEALSLGVLDSKVIADHVRRGAWKASDVVRQGPIPDSLARAWLANRVLTHDAYMRGSLEVWQPQDPLPLAHVRHACSHEDLETLLMQVALPTDVKIRMAYAQRMATAHCQGIEAYLTMVTGTATTCTVCAESLNDERPAFKQAACAHDASICTPCATQHVERAAVPTCHDVSCRVPYTPNDTARLKRDGTAICEAMLAAHAPNPAVWSACATDGCVGGKPTAQVRAHTPCRICDKVSITRGFDWGRDGVQVQRLIAGLYTDQRDVANVTVRECYHCGTATERNGGCPHMNCVHCHQDWDFNEGPWGAAVGHHGMQRYVPRGGLLLRTGLYGDLAPGSTGVDNLVDHVLAQAERMGLRIQVPEGPRMLARLRRRRLALQ